MKDDESTFYLGEMTAPLRCSTFIVEHIYYIPAAERDIAWSSFSEYDYELFSHNGKKLERNWCDFTTLATCEQI